MGTAGRGRERASEAPARLVEGRRGAAPDVPVLQSARALPMQPASKRSEQIESAWPFANFTGGMGGRLRQGAMGASNAGAAYLLPITADGRSRQTRSALSRVLPDASAAPDHPSRVFARREGCSSECFRLAS